MRSSALTLLSSTRRRSRSCTRPWPGLLAYTIGVGVCIVRHTASRSTPWRRSTGLNIDDGEARSRLVTEWSMTIRSECLWKGTPRNGIKQSFVISGLASLSSTRTCNEHDRGTSGFSFGIEGIPYSTGHFCKSKNGAPLLLPFLFVLLAYTNRKPYECRFGTVILVLTVAQVILSIAQVVASF